MEEEGVPQLIVTKKAQGGKSIASVGWRRDDRFRSLGEGKAVI